LTSYWLVLLLPHRLIMGNHDHKLVTKRFCLFDVVQMARMKQVEDSNRHHSDHHGDPVDIFA